MLLRRVQAVPAGMMAASGCSATVAHVLWEPEVAGSNPAAPTSSLTWAGLEGCGPTRRKAPRPHPCGP